MNDDSKLGVGVIGLGEIGQFHLRGFASSSECEVRAVSDIDAALAEDTASRFGASSYTSYQELLSDAAIAIVSIGLPHRLHREVLLAAIAAGKHVLCEKPLCMTVGECDEVIDAAARANVTVGVQHNQLFYPPHVRAKEMIDNGSIGRPVLMRLRLAIGGKFRGWRTDPAVTGGGILFDAGVHRFYVARYLLGEVDEVMAMADNTRLGGEDVAVVGLRFRSGALGVIEANYHAPPGSFDDNVEICGTEGTLYVSGCEAEFEGFRTGPRLTRFDGSWHYEKTSQGDWADSVAESICAFVSAVARGEEAPVTAKDGRQVVQLIESVYDAISAP
jgi:UDP-N-acetylglucosamine 3-dehydrogenase